MFACLNYHDVGDRDTQYCVSREQLRQHLHLLRSSGFRAADFADLRNRLQNNAGIPQNYALLTVDDGRKSGLTFADLCEQFGLKATFFVIRDRCSQDAHYLHPTKIRALRDRGFSFGTHGCSHRPFTALSHKELLSELHSSREWLEDILGERVEYMAAPGGFVNHRVIRAAYEDGIVLLGTCREAINKTEHLKVPCTIHRVNIRRHFSLQDVERLVTGENSFYLKRQLRSAVFWFPKLITARTA